MPYTVRVDNPNGPKPEDNWIKWTMWAEKNAPFASVTTPDMATYLSRSGKNETSEIFAMGGKIPAAAVRSIPAWSGVEVPVAKVVEFARLNGYGLIVEVTGQTVAQYLQKSGSD